MQPRRGEGSSSSKEPGRITLAMRAVSVSGPRALRIALVRGGRIEEERLVRDGAQVSVGRSERATLVVDAPGLGAATPLFTRARGGYALTLPAGLSARVQAAGAVLELPAQRERRKLVLGPDARGAIRLGDARLLFQMVTAPPRFVSRLPLAVLRDPERMDWPTTIIAACSFVAHFALVGAMYSDWVDPVLDEAVSVSGLVAELSALPLPPEVEDAKKSDAAPSLLTAAPTRPQASRGPAGPPAGGHAPPRGSLVAELERVELATLGALGTGRPATDGVLKQREVPTSQLDDAARSGNGVSSGGTLALSGGPSRIEPRAGNDLSQLANTRASVSTADTGGVARVEGPRPDAFTAAPAVHGGAVSDAAAVVAGLRAGFRRCYREALDEAPDAAGGVRVTIQVGPNGTVTGVTTQSSGSLPGSLASCVAARTRGASFQPPEGGAAVIVVPVTFVLQR